MMDCDDGLEKNKIIHQGARLRYAKSDYRRVENNSASTVTTYFQASLPSLSPAPSLPLSLSFAHTVLTTHRLSIFLLPIIIIITFTTTTITATASLCGTSSQERQKQACTPQAPVGLVHVAGITSGGADEPSKRLDELKLTNKGVKARRAGHFSGATTNGTSPEDIAIIPIIIIILLQDERVSACL